MSSSFGKSEFYQIYNNQSGYKVPDNPYQLEQLSEYRWRVAQDTIPGMRVPGEIIASSKMIPHVMKDRTPQQVANVATLPGIIKVSLAMPDIHWGYGFPIGGVAAFDLDEGIISPGGVGYDINCGVSLVRTDFKAVDIRNRLRSLVDILFDEIPCGVGSEGKIKLSFNDFEQVLERGVEWVIRKGLADREDAERMEENGSLIGGDPSLVSKRAFQRAEKQLGTLGSGNHFIEIQEVTDVYYPEAAESFGLFQGQVVVMIHSGSRGLGHQVCDDYLKVMQEGVRKYRIELPDRQLACVPFNSPEGQQYFKAMKCAANYAWGNRLTMVGLARRAFKRFFKKSCSDLGMRMVYDVAHNIAKIEEFNLEGKKRNVCVHRKGATRALGPGDERIPAAYRSVGQPVIIPGDMGRASFVLAGAKGAETISFNSTCHGAGRVMSRKAAIRNAKGKDIAKDLAGRGIIVKARGKLTLLEEVPEAYKDIGEVVNAVEGAGISRKVARMKPMGTVKG